MAFVYMHIFSLTFAFDLSLLLLNVTLRGVSNKHCLLSLFSFTLIVLSLVVLSFVDLLNVASMF